MMWGQSARLQAEMIREQIEANRRALADLQKTVAEMEQAADRFNAMVDDLKGLRR